MRSLLSLIFVATLFSCTPPAAELKTGTWRAVIDVQNQLLPFSLDVEKKDGNYIAYIRNSEEKILLDEVTVTGDSVEFHLHVFDASLKAKIEGDKLTGTFVK